MASARWTKEKYLEYRDWRWRDLNSLRESLDDEACFWEANAAYRAMLPPSRELSARIHEETRRLSELRTSSKQLAQALIDRDNEESVIAAIADPTVDRILKEELVTTYGISAPALERVFTTDCVHAQMLAACRDCLSDEFLRKILGSDSYHPWVKRCAKGNLDRRTKARRADVLGQGLH